jgi:endoglucanase
MFDGKAIKILKTMTESFGPSGFERETTQIIKKYMKPYSDEIIVDKLGSMVFVNRGENEVPNVLIAGHIDEIGFVVSSINENTGFLSFNTLGGWWDQVLLSQKVVVRTGKGDLTGVISAKPPHLLTKKEITQVIEKRKMYIDIGATSGIEAAEFGVKIGDPIVPWSPFSFLKNEKIVMGKAFDDRIGAFVLMEAFRRIKEENTKHPNALFGVTTVQEELGARGAQTVAHLIDPDVALIVEAGIAGDAPDIKPFEAQARMGKGPSLVTYDRSMIPNQPLKEFVIKTANEIGIPLQLSQSSRGGTDAGRIHLNKIGCPSVVLSVPTRNIHSHIGILSLEDTENTVNLIIELTKRLDLPTVNDFTNI